MKRKLLILLTVTLILVSLYPEQQTEALDKSSDVFLIETVDANFPVYAGSNAQSKVMDLMPANQKALVTSELVNSQNEHWLHIKYNDTVGWIPDQGFRQKDIKGQLLTPSLTTAPIRKGALATYRQADVLQKGETVTPLDAFTNGLGEKWVRITNGKVTGWVALADLQFFNGETNYFNRQVFIKTTTNVKRSATSSSSTSGSLTKGKIVTLQSEFISNNEPWYRITAGNLSGWIPAAAITNQLDLSTSIFAKNQTVDVKRGASSKYNTVTRLSTGQKVQAAMQFINEKNELWYKVVLGNGKSGWARASSFTTQKLKIAYLTIDDGPTYYTSKLLNILNQYHAKATFFMLNGNMNAHPADVRRMVKDGHAIGSHSVTHDVKRFYASPASAVGEMVTTRNTIKRITGITSNLMRVPYGSVPYMKQPYRTAMTKQHFIMWDWNVDSEDWRYNGSGFVNSTLSHVKSLNKSGAVPVILIHDRKATIDSLQALLSGIEKQGYTLVPLTESVQAYQFRIR
jgi:peptidoglycan/xylan/chitin deacetylase (PgdA/CDA1 family)